MTDEIKSLVTNDLPLCEGVSTTGKNKGVACACTASMTINGKNFCKKHAAYYILNEVLNGNASITFKQN
jgi:hypothetical protein